MRPSLILKIALPILLFAITSVLAGQNNQPNFWALGQDGKTGSESLEDDFEYWDLDQEEEEEQGSEPNASPQVSHRPSSLYNFDVNTIAKPEEKAEENKQIIAQADEPAPPTTPQEDERTILVNFTNINIIEFIRFLSRISTKNFIFDQEDLDFNVTIISEEPTTVENVMTALLQELRVHGFTMIEQGNNIIIHKSDDVTGISSVVLEGQSASGESEIVTQVFKLNTLDPAKAAGIVRPLVSAQALIEVSQGTQHLIVTDLTANVRKIGELLSGIDAPNSGLVVGQYLVRNTPLDGLISLTLQIMAPIAKEQALTFIPHQAANSVFIVSTPYLVERSITMMERLDQYQGKTQIFDLDEMRRTIRKPKEAKPKAKPPGISPDEEEEEEEPEEPQPPGWDTDLKGNLIFRPTVPSDQVSPDEIPAGEWILDPDGNWYFLPEGEAPPFSKEELSKKRETPILPGEAPKGRWTLDSRGAWVFQLSPGEPVKPESITRSARLQKDLPPGHIERTQFFIHKLQYRKGEEVTEAMERISESLSLTGTNNQDLITTLNSAQWLESSNSIIFTGIPDALGKAKELIDEVDAPLRQVFIEMLILETTIDDSLDYGVSWSTRSGGGNTSTAQAFIGNANPLATAMNTTGTEFTPNASQLANQIGFNLGVIGQRIIKGGTQFASIGALVTAEHTRGTSNIVFNPKLLTEDNAPAEIFVGINTPFQTESIANDEGSIITNNFEFRDVGTRMRVTPHIGHNNVITLEIEQEVSRDLGQGIVQQGQEVTTPVVGPTTSINRTNTTVHIPDGFFLVMSGMIQNERQNSRTYLPCLGAIPIIGAAFSFKSVDDAKRNLMIFLRPKIVDTEEEIDRLTRQQQDIWKEKNKLKKSWKFQVDEALDFLNINRNCCDDCPY